jgi:general secretion pathway protein K
MDYELYGRIEPAVTIYAGSAVPNPAFAPLEALRALPNMTDDFARQIIALRQSVLPGQPSAQPIVLPDGTPLVANGGGVTYSVKSRAQLPNGVSTVLDASIRLGGVGATGRPYTVLRWRDGETS